MLNLTGADTECKSSECAMCGGVRVTTHDSSAGQSKPLLGPNDMYNALSLVTQSKIGELEVFHILLESFTLQARVVLFNELSDVLEILPRCGRDIVVGGDQGAIRSSDFAVGVFETFECLWGRDFMDEVAINVKETLSVILVDNVAFKHFVVAKSNKSQSYSCYGAINDVMSTHSVFGPDTALGILAVFGEMKNEVDMDRIERSMELGYSRQ
nr:hypothetical protein CFP56_26019 [Quercus suber]